jgi:hypothetical protein
MQLRSGKVYDATYEVRKQEFMRFDNLLFAAIWEECREHYINNLQGDYFNKEKIKQAQKMFSEELLKSIDQYLSQKA